MTRADAFGALLAAYWAVNELVRPRPGERTVRQYLRDKLRAARGRT